MIEEGAAAPLTEAVASRLTGTPLLVLLDIDGTLAPIAPRPEEAVVPPETHRTIAALAECDGVHVALVTGRAAAAGRRMVAVARAWVIGNHGVETWSPEGEMEVHPAAEPWIEALAQASRELSAALAPIAGVIVEDKTWSLSVHYRLADPGIGPRLRAVVDEVAERLGLAVTSGKMLIEVRAPVEVNKGTAVIALAERLGALDPGASVIFAGDDVTDEDAFRRLRIEHPGAVTVRVTEHPEMPTAAEFAVRDPAAVQDGLERLLVLRRRRVAD